MSNITKSLADLDTLADDILSKSVKPDTEDEPKPDEIAENPPKVEKPEEDEKKTEEPEKTDDIPEENSGDINKCGDNKVIKSEDSDNIVGEDEDEPTPDKDELEKSLTNDFKSEDDIQKGMDASEFLSSVVEILSKSLADIAYDVRMSDEGHKSAQSILAKSIQAQLELNKSMAAELSAVKSENAALKKSIEDGFAGLKSTLDEVLAQPVGMRKSVGNIQVMDRNFQKSLNGVGGSTIENLSKSQIMDILNAELYKGNPNVTASDIISYESGAPLKSDLVTMINNRK